MTDSFATTDDGVRLRCIDFGGKGRDLLLCHATGFAGEIFTPWIDRLAKRYKVFGFDFRGHGQSDKPQGTYAWENFAHDVIAVCDHFSLHEPFGVGHSKGAAALVGAQHLKAPFKQLALMDPTLPAFAYRESWQENSKPMIAAALKRRRVWDSREQFIERMSRAGSPMAGFANEFMNAYAHCGLEETPDDGFRLRCPPEVEAAIYGATFGLDFYKAARDLTIPATFLLGTESHLGWTQENSPCPIVYVKGSHFFPMENPDETLDSVLQCLDSDARL